MLYQLFSLFNDFPGARLMSYISFRAVVAGVLAMCISIWVGRWFIQLLQRKNISETQRDESIDPFNVAKKGVPTMGGVVIIAAILLPCLLVGRLSNIYMILMLITTIILGCIGFADDYIKTFRKNKDGLNGWIKIAGQITLGLIVGLTLRYSPEAVILKYKHQMDKPRWCMPPKRLRQRKLLFHSSKRMTLTMRICSLSLAKPTNIRQDGSSLSSSLFWLLLP